MRTFEEKFTAWVDGEMSGSELVEFEAELSKTPGALSDCRDQQKLSAFLRTHAAPAELKNADFFNHQLRERIEADQRTLMPAKREHSFWPLSRLIWAGALSLFAAALLIRFTIPFGPHEIKTESEYLAEVLNTRTGDPAISATTFHSKENLTVLWLDGLDYLPENYAVK
jgi:hypothetical protein